MRFNRLLTAVVCLYCLLSHAALAVSQEEIDFAKAKAIRQRILSGDSVTSEEWAYFERAKALRQAGGARRRPMERRKLPVGLKPLTEMTADDRYKGEDGGLYGGGKNEPPVAHLAAAQNLANSIRPLDAMGNEAATGKIALVSIGMSNTTQEFSAFMQAARFDSDKSASVILVDGAQGGMEAQAWHEMQRPWDTLDARLASASISPLQVQVVWMKQARRSPASLGEYPQHVNEMKEHLLAILHKLKDRFPNLKIVYLSSRIYAGYASTNLNPEPYAYESAYAVRQLIEEQIKGASELNYDDARGKVHSPLLLWGPYLWADGENGRSQDDLVWKLEDFAQDGTHPSPSGRRKVADQLLRFFKEDPTAVIWFLKK